ncbi:GNAT family N-acetyltransferase [Nonomuraea roseola]|uniref:GNAT family N-acetyltransferase n=1 Tax=Nonomuraea roseola TaxID=46179 RepID=UPI0031F803F8
MRVATGADLGALAAVLAAAFHSDPVARWIEPDDTRRRRILPQAYAMQLRGLFLTQGATEVVVHQGAIKAGALWNPPGQWRMPVLSQVRQLPTALRLAGRRIGRLMSVARAVEAVHPAEPHWYLAELGTDPQAQGTGLGRALLDSRLARCDAEGSPAYLESPEANIPLYERFGFEVTGEVHIPGGGPTVYTMWRKPRLG